MKKNKFVVIGGITSKYAAINLKLGKKYNTNEASIDILDWDTKEIVQYFRFTPDIKFRSEDLGKDIRFTSGSWREDGKLMLCSPTQAYVFDFENKEIVKEYNSTIYNDLHHILPFRDGYLLANTGLDSVVKINQSGEVEEIISTNETAVWDKFRKDVDYRKVASTKPHTNHPNFVIDIDGEMWVTRFHNKDAVNVLDRSQKIDIAVGKPHDGHVFGDYIYFTTINGFIVKADKITKEVVERYDLNAIDTRGKDLGWCRSLYVDGDIAYVGFTRLRQTAIESNLRWLKGTIDNSKDRLPARIAKYDLSRKTLIDEFEIPDGFTDLIFSILPAK